MSASVAPLLSGDRARIRLPGGWELPVFSVDALDLRDSDLISSPRRNKDDPRNQRFVYRQVDHGDCIKVWSPAYARAPNFVNALKVGFYDCGLCSALSGVLIDDDLECRGYLMRQGNLLKHEVPASLLRSLLHNSIRTNHFYYDLVRCVIAVDGGYSLIDLEGVYDFSELAPYWRARLIGKRTRGCVASPLSYHRALSRLRRKLRTPVSTDDLHPLVDRLVAGLPFVLGDR